MSDHTKWIEAAAALIRNPYSQILCPECGLGFLNVKDEQLDNEHIDRHLICPNCGAHETVLKRLSTKKPLTEDDESG